MAQEMFGIIPPMTTPFDADGEIDEAAVRAQVRWLLDRGVHGLAAGGSTGEGHTLDADELRAWSRPVEEADGRVPVIAGIIVDSTRDAIRRGTRSEVSASPRCRSRRALPVPAGRRRHAGAFSRDLRGHRAAGDHLQRRAVELSGAGPAGADHARGAGRDRGQAECRRSQAGGRPAARRPARDQIFSAVDALLYPSFMLGAHGTIAALPTAAPGPCVALWDAVQRGDHGRAHDLHRRLLRLWNALVGDNLPACVKHAQTLQGCPAGQPRAPMPSASTEQRRAIAAALEALGRG